MVTIIKKGTSLDRMKKLLEDALSSSPQINIRKYAGILKSDIDPIEYQKRMRSEWE